ncbi:MAG TPA: hypothetical protein VN682_10235 [Terriglobales bacterium]|nr:hypothetical protein [Terriglobales bacterium]
MSTSVVVNTYTHSVTYVADNIQRTLKNILVLSGLDPGKLTSDWESTNRALRTWIDSKHLETIVLEISNASGTSLIGRWDIEIAYGWEGGDGSSFWVDTDQIKTAVRKAGVHPASCEYRLICVNKPGRPAVSGWGSTTLLSTAGFTRQSLGGTVEHSGLGASTSYYRRSQ